MSSQRLTFLYPYLFQATRPAPFGTSTTSNEASFAPRVGKGIEPRPLAAVKGALEVEPHIKASKDGSAIAGPGVSDVDGRDSSSTPEQNKDAAKASEPAPRDTAAADMLSSPGGVAPEDRKKIVGKGAAAAARDSERASSSSKKKKHATGPMDAVLRMDPPDKRKPQGKPPHLTPPPYVHHFDSYSLVKQLEAGGFAQTQAITAMKAVRGLLAQHLDVAQGGLISKSDVENETYLFRAACAELSTEVKNNRRVADEQLRQQRTVLQHEVDNTTQVLNQELVTLNDNVKGMFNDRKMAVREEHKAAESAIQQIAYKISVTLNSDSKSEIEAVRWVLARRAVIGLFYMVTLSLLVLRYSSVVSQEQKKEERKEERKEKEEAEALKKSDGSKDAAFAPDAAEILTAN